MTAPFEAGQLVTIIEAPEELLRGLPTADQKAIKACVGQPGTYLGTDPHGYLEIEFNRPLQNTGQYGSPPASSFLIGASSKDDLGRSHSIAETCPFGGRVCGYF